MKKLELIKDDPSFESGYVRAEDAFNHDSYADMLLKVIQDNSPPLSVGLFGSWGVGKSSIINDLRGKCQAENVSFVYFNAWQYSGDSFRRQFLLEVARNESIIKSKELREKKEKRLKTLNHSSIEKSKAPQFKFSQTGLGVALILMGFTAILFIVAAVLRYFNLLPAEVAGYSIGVAGFFAAITAILFQKIEQIFEVKVDTVTDPQLLFPEQFTDEFHMLMLHAKRDYPDNKVVIVVDDLDRCDAETIKNVLTALKTFLGQENCIFIIPLDDSSVVQMFKEKNTNHGYEQLRKYFSVSVRIPGLHSQDLITFAKQTAAKYDISADVAYVAGLGFCRDARKLKHFLNMYKLKYEMARRRAEEGFLADIEVERIQRQLAKIVVLEYQFPEFYKFLTIYPDTVGLFTAAARGESFPEGKGHLFSEIDNNLKKLGDVWKAYPGLREFLCVTYDIRLQRIDVLVRLKVSEEEGALGEVGVRLRKAIDENEINEFIEGIDEKFITNNAEAIVHTLDHNYFDANLLTPSQRAINLAIEILNRNWLPDEWQTKLYGNLVEISTRILYEYKYTRKNVYVILDNFGRANQNQKAEVVKKLKEDIFKKSNLYVGFNEVINHKEFKSILAVDPMLAEHIDSAILEWFKSASVQRKKADIAKSIKDIRYSKEEREIMDFEHPSEELMRELIKAMAANGEKKSVELNRNIIAVINNQDNPNDLEDLIPEYGAKLAENFKVGVSGNEYTDTLKVCCDAVLNMNDWLDSESAVNIANSITGHFPSYSDKEAKLAFLLVLVTCICSLDEGSTERETYTAQYYGFVDGLQAEDFKTHIDELAKNCNYEHVNEFLKKAIVERKWKQVDQRGINPDEEIVKLARVIEEHKALLKPDVYAGLFNKILTIVKAVHLQTWVDYVVEVFPSFRVDSSEDIDDQKDFLDKLKEQSENGSITSDVRLVYADLFVQVLLKCDKKKGIQYFSSIYRWLSLDDETLRNVMTNSLDDLVKYYGEQVPKSQITTVMANILDNDDISDYANALAKCKEYYEDTGISISHKLCEKINMQLFDVGRPESHRNLLLDLAGGIKDAGNHGEKLSEVLFSYKETGDNDNLKKKAWEIYQALTEKELIKPYTPPDEESTTE